MNKLTKTTLAIAVAGLAALGSLNAQAWGGGGPGMRDGKAGWHQMAPEDMQARMAQRMEVQLARLELALVLTPEQKPAWESFKAGMQAQAGKHFARMAEYRAAERPATAIERMQRMETHMAARQTELAERRELVQGFYAGLSDAQKTVFDDEFGRFSGVRGQGARCMPGGGDDPRDGRGGRGMGPGRG